MRANLEGQVALVTGAARGIGLAIADRMDANGATVLYTDVDERALAQTVVERDGASGLPLDVTDPNAVRQVVERVVAEHGRLDILVNNAGVNTLSNRVTIDQFSRQEWDRVLAVDLHGVFEMSRRAAAVMRAQQSGRIVNIASVVGLVPLRLQIAFAAAKAAVVNLTRAMAIELGQDGVLVNGIAPGSTLTEATAKLFYDQSGAYHEQAQTLLDHVPLGRPGTPDEIAVAALFLVDPENSYTNGHVLVVDGGWTAGYHRDF